jgi:hypothetical protein
VEELAHGGKRALKLIPGDPFSQAKLSQAPGALELQAEQEQDSRERLNAPVAKAQGAGSLTIFVG